MTCASLQRVADRSLTVSLHAAHSMYKPLISNALLGEHSWWLQAVPCQADSLTSALQNIIDSNNSVREALEKGLDAVKLQENWDYLQINCAMYINSDMPGVASQSQPNTKPLRHALLLQCCITCCPASSL